jgi:peptidoglycan/xylan/chitin deacetylase (PgdA/CDA1 family)
MRKALRSAVEFALVASGAPARGRRRVRGDTLVLAYHNIVPDDTPAFGDRSLHLPLGRFRRQLAMLATTHDLVELDALDHPSGDGRPRAAITFDDAYAGALRFGVPALRDAGVPATIFVAPGILGRDAMWWDLLADPIGGLDTAVRTHALETLRGEHEAILAWARAGGLPLAEPAPHARIGDAEELAAALATPGITLGLHTWSHPNLARLDEDEAREEIGRSGDWLATHAPHARPWLAFPYGQYAPPALRAAASLGLTRAFRIEGGWMRAAGAPPLESPRLNVPAGLSERGFLLRLSGALRP